MTAETGRDLATEPLRPERTLGELFAEMTGELGTLFRKEVELAKVEAREEGRRAARAAGMFGAAGAGAVMALTLLSFAAAWLLDDVMARSLAFAVIGVLWAVAAAVLMRSARREAARIEPLPDTTQTIKEDVQWARTQTS